MKTLTTQHLLLAVIFLCFLLNSCTKKADIGTFDKVAWQGDEMGCTGARADMTKAIMELKPKLLGLYQKTLIDILGKPEEQELYERSQTYYIYHIDPAASCDNTIENPRRLLVRFTALGIANEVNIR